MEKMIFSWESRLRSGKCVSPGGPVIVLATSELLQQNDLWENSASSRATLSFVVLCKRRLTTGV